MIQIVGQPQRFIPHRQEGANFTENRGDGPGVKTLESHVQSLQKLSFPWRSILSISSQ
jgi:hypothetical protein